MILRNSMCFVQVSDPKRSNALCVCVRVTLTMQNSAVGRRRRRSRCRDAYTRNRTLVKGIEGSYLFLAQVSDLHRPNAVAAFNRK